MQSDIVSSMAPPRRWLSAADRVRRAAVGTWREGGPRALARAAAEALYWRFNPDVRRWRAELPAQEESDRAFDRRFHVDTAGELSLEEVGIRGAEIERGHGRYRPVWSSVFHQALAALPIEFERFTFVDYGSGKGKALLLASDYRFAEIVGIEFARPLHDIASRNLSAYSSPAQRCRKLSSQCLDAAQFIPPERPLVCFFFNPFDDATMRTVLGALAESARRAPREIFLVYCNMRDVREHAHVFDESPQLERLESRSRFLVYRMRSPLR